MTMKKYFTILGNKGEFVSVPFWWDFEAYKFKNKWRFL